MALERPEAQDFVIVGATGDLSRRKLLPALYNLRAAGLIQQRAAIIGFARSRLDDDGFRRLARESVQAHSRTALSEDAWRDFAAHLYYVRAEPDGFAVLAERCREAQRTFYLATPPEAVPEIVRGLTDAGLNEGARVVIEKPFGQDTHSAHLLNETLHAAFDEPRIFRIDHYLGKETVQNILILRFENSIFERVWNRDSIAEVQVTVAESLGVEGRGAFYDRVGALRDMVQSHVLQMLTLLTMEPPDSFDPEAIRDEKRKLLRAIHPLDPRRVVRAQYVAGVIDGGRVAGYRAEPNVAPGSETETFVALELFIDNWRWAGVPFYVRTGKRLPYRATEVEIAFKPAPIDYLAAGEGHFRHANHLILRIQPDEGIDLRFLAKTPGPELRMKQVDMEFHHTQGFMVEPAEAYERLVHDVMVGDQTLFVREDAIERAWQIIEPVLESPPPVCFYRAGDWGPPEADALIAPGSWHLR